MNLPRDLINLINQHYIYRLVNDDLNYIENLSPEKIRWIRKHKLFDLMKLSEYEGIHAEDASGSLNWAVEQGYLDICEWIDDNTHYTFECHFNNHPQILAVRGGHLEMMMWLKSHAIPPNQSAFSLAKANGHQHILDWLSS